MISCELNPDALQLPTTIEVQAARNAGLEWATQRGSSRFIDQSAAAEVLGSHYVPRKLLKGASVCLHLCVCLSVSPLIHIAQIHNFRRIDSSFHSSSSPKVVKVYLVHHLPNSQRNLCWE